MSNEEILTHLEAELEVEDDGDPVKGIAIGVLLGTALWVVSLAVLAELL